MKRILRTAVICGAALTMVSTATVSASADDAGLAFDDPQPGFAPAGTVLTEATPADVGLDPAPLQEAWQRVVAATGPEGERDHPLFPGAVLTYGHDGHVVMQEATGHSRLFADGQGTELPEAEQIATTTDTIYDLASVSKLFTSVVVMQQVEAGRVALDEPVTTYIPEFTDPAPGADPDEPAEHDKSGITIRQLLTHTSGFPAWVPLWSTQPDPQSRLHAALTAALVDEPGTTYTYSDLNLITLAEVASRVSGQPLDELVRTGITDPLGMDDTGYNPDPSLRPRIAATEFQATPDRGVVWGEVHDENAWSLGGVAGHAGVFSTADDLSRLAQAMLNGGSYDGQRVLSEQSVQQMITNENTEFPEDAHGLGFELDQRWYMGGLASPRTAGHTGYTGTSLVLDFQSRSFVILLTNRVHPSRSWGSPNPVRVAAAQGLAEAMAVRPQRGEDFWHTGTEPRTDAALTWSLVVPRTGGQLEFETLVDVESTDPLHLEVSTDSGETWAPLPWTLDGAPVSGPYAASGLRQWQHGEAALPSGRVQVRWRQTTDASLSGRGVHLDDIRLTLGRGQAQVGTEDAPWRLVAEDGWERVTR
ncbi:class A beta-lactamase-related serine hydrolase [Desertihabitans brevis]|uniref:Class A beta-lactamase-related serine hydrolase n=1 Tax=Desertihabitans brevis TaxID=2268447 RepID=A0A367YSJ4_9ACTN|nr:serine hydrolase domain-containing protein [Desertihabitans brevis]RCK68770.1 class A beta-lactamase-related serine hydrolase [Desertihabitans brevis]